MRNKPPDWTIAMVGITVLGVLVVMSFVLVTCSGRTIPPDQPTPACVVCVSNIPIHC